MAWTDDREKDLAGQTASPYMSVLNEQPQQAAAPEMAQGGADQPAADPYADTSQTGYLNFSRFYNANEGAAKAGAKRINEGVNKAAQKAKTDTDNAYGAYTQTLTGTGKAADSMYDDAGNWLGGAAGPLPELSGNMTGPQEVQSGGSAVKGNAAEGSSSQGGSVGRFGPGNVQPDPPPSATDGKVPPADPNEDVRYDSSYVDANGNQLPVPEKLYTEWQGLIAQEASQGKDPGDMTKLSDYLAQNGYTPPTAAGTTPPPDTGPKETDADARRRAALAQGLTDAQSSLDGIKGFTDSDAYARVLSESGEADRELNALGSDYGLAGLGAGTAADAALFGAAGRPDFAKTQQQYGKGLLSDLDAKTEQAQKDEAAARQKFQTRGDAYAQQLGDMDKEHQAEVDAWQKAKDEADRKAKDAAGRAERRKKFDEMRRKADSPLNHWREVSDLLDLGGSVYAAASGGEQGPVQALMDKADGGRESTVWEDTDVDFDIWASMTEEERYAFSKMGPRQQREYIEKKRKEHG